MSLVCRLEPEDGGDWRKCAERYARRHGLESEVLEYYDDCIEEYPDSPEEACWCALYEWDLLDLEQKEGQP